MPAPNAHQEEKQVPLKIAGGCQFGRYKKISDEATWNMIVSDGALVDYAGYKHIFEPALVPTGIGRGIYSSTNGNLMAVAVGAGFYTIDATLGATAHGHLQSSVGDVFITENNNHEIVITDKEFMYVYNYVLDTFLQSSTTNPPPTGFFYAPFSQPGYVSFQGGRIIVVDLTTQKWYLSGINDATQWDVTNTTNPAYEGTIQNKPDQIQAVVPIPGLGLNLAVFGKTGMEVWHFTGDALFPYATQPNFNIDYGCLNASSIASLDNFIVWLSANEQGGPALMKYSGGREEQISTDGIDFQFSKITDPTNCTGFLFRQDGHLLYQFTFITDNFSYVYDFTTKMFFSVSDENQDYHIARNVVFFQNDYYFVSLDDGNLYEFGTQFPYLQYSSTSIKQMPRIRICPPIRLTSQRYFIAKNITFTIENGQPNQQQYGTGPTFFITQDGDYLQTQDGDYLVDQRQTYPIVGQFSECIDLSVSRDGAASFGNSKRYTMNMTGDRVSRLQFQRLGHANDFTPQLRFIGYGRFIAFDGYVTIYE